MSLDPVTRSRMLTIGKFGLAVALIVAILSAVDGREAWRMLRSADPAWLLLAFALLSLQTVLSAVRWRLTARQLDQRIGLMRAIREYYLSQVINQSLPGGMLGDAGRAMRARGQAGLRLASLGVALERLAGQVAMAAVMAAGLVAAVAVDGGLQPPTWLAGTVAAICAGLAGAAFVAHMAGALPGAVGRAMGGFVVDARRALTAPGVLWWQIGLSLATAACNLLAFAACARAIGIALPAGAVAVLVPLILFAMLIPITVAGWGLREGAAAALLPLAGTSGAAGLAASVAFGLVFLAAVLPGLWPLLASRRATSH
ncbi:lysylphosphatidylglycerol synthase transmembrane domain-containing protein [Citreimonas sp.]|uniref:lysylphosphatidylglycerol synthase transmembrane domain-containing protein n=1 Tax=Citreimonas sp. TaxID=3036715 RepID=UPI00405A00B0